MRTLLSLLLGLMSFNSLAASVDYRIHWRTLRTPHFEIIYDREQKELAETYGVAAEQAYEILRTRFSEQPTKTTVVLMDITDQANGAATFLPYYLIQVFPVLPDSLTTLDYYGNWPLEMMLHEYTHVSAFTPVHGWMKPLHYVFGSVLHPNGVLPRWWHEGLAVESETRFTNFGRLRSPRMAAELRALAIDGKLKSETIDRINETILPEFPYGERPYIFGSLLWEHMLQKTPENTNLVETLTQRYSKRFPFFINGPVEDSLGADYARLLEESYDEIEIKMHEQVDLIQAKQKESFERFASLDMEQFQPAISPDGSHLLFISGSLRRGQIRIIDREGNQSFHQLESKKLLDVGAPTRVSWIPDSRSFIYDAINENDPYHSYRELFEYNLDTKRSTQLTKELRAQEPGVSIDGQKIVFVGNRAGKQWLGLFDRATKATKTLFHPGLSVRIGHPEFISDTQILFTGRNPQGLERLYVYDLKVGKMKMEMGKKTNLRRPTRTALGILAADTSTGVQNIGIVDLQKQTFQPITNTTTEIQGVDYDPRTKQLIATRYTGEGRKLVVTSPTDVTPPEVGPLVQAKWPKPPTPPTIDKGIFKEESYQPWQYLYPRYWIPFVYPVYGGIFMQASTSVADPTNINKYDASVAYDTVTGRPGYSFQFVNSSLPPDIYLGYTRSEQYLGASGFVFDAHSANGGLAFYLPWLGRHWKMSTGYVYEHVDSAIATDQLFRQGPTATLQYNNWLDPRAEGAGTIFIAQHTQFLAGKNDNEIAYGRSFMSFTQAWKKWLPATHRIVATARGELSPELPFTHFGNFLSLADSSLGANYLVPLTNSPFLFRGYTNGTFVGRKVINWNLEYQWALSRKAKGWGTLPIFSRGWDLAIVFDGIGVDGASYNINDVKYWRRDLGEIALSAGAEARWNTSLFYAMPVTWIFGLYNGFDDKAGTGLMPFVGLAFSDLSSIDRLRKQ